MEIRRAGGDSVRMTNSRSNFDPKARARMIDRPGSRDFVQDLAQGLHRCGTPVNRIEAVVQAVCEYLEVDVRCFATPTCLFISSHRGTQLLRVEPGSVDLGQMAAIDAIAASVARGEATVDWGRRQLAALDETPPLYSLTSTVAAFGAVSATVALLFGRTLQEAGVSLALGLGVGLLGVLTSRNPSTARLFEGTAAAGATAVAALLAVVVPLAPHAVALTALIVLVPGFTLTVALSELNTGHLAAGTSRLALATMTFLQLGVGSALGWRLIEVLPALPPPEAVAWSGPVQALALAVASAAVAVLIKGRPSDLPVIVTAGALAFYGAGLGGSWLGPLLGPFIGAFAVGLFANVQARVRDVPASVASTPGILLLVPGSLGYRGVEAFLAQQALVGVTAVFETFLVGASLVAGLMLANAVVSPGRPL